MQAYATTPHYRKTKTGEWVVMAPVAQLRAGETITVHKRDGSTKTETISKVGKAFECDGVQQAYGYISRPTEIYRPHKGFSAPRTRRSVPRYERCRACGGDGGVEAELGECGSCHVDFD